MHCEKDKKKEEEEDHQTKKTNQLQAIQDWVGGAKQCKVFLARRTDKNMLRALCRRSEDPLGTTEFYIRENTLFA